MEIKIKCTGRLRKNLKIQNKTITQMLEVILNPISLFTIYLPTCASVKLLGHHESK